MTTTTDITRPQLATLLGASIDTLRQQIRRCPELRRLGTRVGGLVFYSPAEAELIRQAYAESRAGRLRKEVLTAVA